MSGADFYSGKTLFTSDNASGAHPEVLAALTSVNHGRTGAYGADHATMQLQNLATELFGTHAQIYPVFTGTAANILSLTAASPRWGAVLCAESAHIHWDEGGAPEKVAGLKLLTCETVDGKITPEAAAAHLDLQGVEHAAQPTVVSIAQATELGTVYTPAEIRALADFAHDNNMLLHMDGARLANAAVYLDCELREITTDAGVDLLSLGATKNGAVGAEAVVVLNSTAGIGFEYLRKHQMQLASKMRFLSAQLLALYEGELWRTNAQNANERAQQLAAGLRAIESITITRPVEANAVFAALPAELVSNAEKKFAFYDWPSGLPGEYRFVCGWDTTAQEVQELLAALTVS